MALLGSVATNNAYGFRSAVLAGSASACSPLPKVVSSDADRAFAHGQFEDAERLFAAMPPSELSVIGQLRAKIGQGQLTSALTLALQATTEYPQSALLIDVLAEIRYSRGEVLEALSGFRKAIAMDACLARAHYDLSLLLELAGTAASGQKELDLAYQLSPNDSLIRRTWKTTQQQVPTPESQIADMREIESRPAATPAKKAEIDGVIQALEADKRGDCELVSTTAVATVPLVPLFVDGRQMPPTASAIDILFNGKKRRLLLDSGATGIMISHEAAEGLGLTPEAEVTSSGIGDGGASAEYVAHLDHVKIGSLEFRNCKVRVQSQPGGPDVQGLFGTDTLRRLLITLDLPKQELRTAALPSAPPGLAFPRDVQTIAASKRDRYVPPGMEDWTPFFRSSQNILLPVSIGDVPRKLFILDTGAGDGLIAPDVAREVTRLTVVSGGSMRGMNGSTSTLMDTGPMTLNFPGFTGQVKSMTALDLSRFTLEEGVHVSGFIGFNILRTLTIAIDYRDNLLKITQPAKAQ